MATSDEATTTEPATFENGTPQYDISELWVDTVGVQSVPVDWHERGGEDGDGFVSYEAPECECGEYGRYDDEEYAWVCDNADCEQHGAPLEDDETTGPMMNYYYPLPDLRRIGDDPREAAWRIRDLPLCVVEMDGEYALALTGGGMDLSWEICEAFTRLGYLPPLHFCDLPNLAGKPTAGDTLYTVNACLRSADVAAHQAEQTRERLQTKYATPARLEYLRGEIRADRISYGEISELRNIAEHIAPDDVELRQWAGVEEQSE